MAYSTSTTMFSSAAATCLSLHNWRSAVHKDASALRTKGTSARGLSPLDVEVLSAESENSLLYRKQLQPRACALRAARQERRRAARDAVHSQASTTTISTYRRKLEPRGGEEEKLHRTV